MIIGVTKEYLLKEAKIDEFNVRLVKDKNLIALEIESDNSIVFKKNFDNIKSASSFFNSIFQKSDFNLRKARINSDDPKAFRSDSPSSNLWQGRYTSPMDGGGGTLINEIRKVRDNTRNKVKNRKNKKNKNEQRENSWDLPSGKEDKNYQLTKIGPPGGQISRDDETNRGGLADADNWKQRSKEGTRPNIPTDEDSIERMRHPERYNDPNYRGPDTRPQFPSEAENKYKENLTKDKIKGDQDQIRDQIYTVIYEKNGKTQEIPNLSYEKAIQISEQYPACVIRKMERKEKKND